MIKKILMFLLLDLLSFQLVACDKGEDVSLSELIRKNLSTTTTELEPVNKIFVNEFEDFEVVWESNYGILLVEDDEGNNSCWSLFTQKLIFPFSEENQINFIYKIGGLLYIETTNSDDEKAIYDIFGRTIIEKGKYEIAEVDVDFELVADESGETRREYYEIVKTLTIEDLNKGITTPTIKKFLLNVEEESRVEITEETEEEYKRKETIELKMFGLDGYYGRVVNFMLFIYNENNELINRVSLSGADFDIACAFGGKLLMQKSYLLDEENEKYSYINQGNKYLLETFTIDILTGKKTKLKLDYIIHNLSPYQNEKGEYSYAYGAIRRIDSKNLLTAPTNVIINEKGKIIADVHQLELTELTPIGNHFYDEFSGYIYNSDLDPLYLINGNLVFDDCNDIIIVHDGDYYGVVADDGSLLIPFEYVELSEFYQGKALGKYRDGKYYIVDLNRGSTALNGPLFEIATGLIFIYRNDSSPYQADIIDYNNNIKHSLEFDSPASPSFNSINNIYGNYLYASFKNNNQTSYLLIDITLR